MVQARDGPPRGLDVRFLHVVAGTQLVDEAVEKGVRGVNKLVHRAQERAVLAVAAVVRHLLWHLKIPVHCVRVELPQKRRVVHDN